MNLSSPKFLAAAAIVILLIILPFFLRGAMGEYVLHVLIFIFLAAYLAESWNIIGGYAGQLSIGHSAFFGIGAYTSTMLFLWWNVSPWLSMFLGAFFAMSLAAVVGYPCLRLRAVYFALATIAFSEILRVIFLSPLREWTLGALGMCIPLRYSPYNMIFDSKVPYYHIILAMLLSVLIVVYKIENSRLGYGFVAIREDEDVARVMGINVTRYKMMAFIISSIPVALGGTFYAFYSLYVVPEVVMSVSQSIEMVIITLLGGQGTLLGPIFGAALMIPLGEITRGMFGAGAPGLHLIIYGIILIMVVTFIPGGLIDLAYKVYRRIFSMYSKG